MKLAKKKKYLYPIAILLIAFGLIAAAVPSVRGAEVLYLINNDFSSSNSLTMFKTVKDESSAGDPYLPSQYAYLYGNTELAYDTSNKLLNTSFVYNLDFQIRGDWPNDPANTIGAAHLFMITQDGHYTSSGVGFSVADPYIILKRNTTTTGGLYYLHYSNPDTSTSKTYYKMVHYRWYSLTVTVQYNASAQNNVINVYLYDPGAGNIHLVSNDVFTWGSYTKAHWLNIGPFGYGSSAKCGDMYIDNLVISYYSTTPAPSTPESGYDITISKLVWQILFFLPAIIMVQFTGKIGLIGGVAIMAIVFMVTQANFTWCAVLMFITLGAYMYRGGT